MRMECLGVSKSTCLLRKAAVGAQGSRCLILPGEGGGGILAKGLPASSPKGWLDLPAEEGGGP